jgi:hypothetical protein
MPEPGRASPACPSRSPPPGSRTVPARLALGPVSSPSRDIRPDHPSSGAWFSMPRSRGKQHAEEQISQALPLDYRNTALGERLVFGPYTKGARHATASSTIRNGLGPLRRFGNVAGRGGVIGSPLRKPGHIPAEMRYEGDAYLTLSRIRTLHELSR